MTGPERRADLRRRWAAVLPGAEAVGEELLGRWAEPHRRYHTPAHLARVLEQIDVLGPPPGDGGRAVRLAAWFHDAVYRPGEPGNEEASAGLALAVLPGAGVPAATVAEVARLVRLTAGHRPDPGDRPGAVLCDADLAVLGLPPAAYGRYVRSVREEHAAVDDAGWRRGRAAVLRSLLDRPAIYSTGPGRRRWEAPARRNLAGELAALGSGPAAGAG